MNADLKRRLSDKMERLHERARALAHPGNDHDMSEIMSALAVFAEALHAIGNDIDAINADRR